MTVPDSMICTPTIARNSVDFPQPLGPSSPVTAPDLIASVNLLSTGRPPRATVRSEMTIAGLVDMPREAYEFRA